MAHGGHLSSVSERLAVVDFDAAYQKTMEEFCVIWKASMKDEVFRRITYCYEKGDLKF